LTNLLLWQSLGNLALVDVGLSSLLHTVLDTLDPVSLDVASADED
jgi:hypothetical protein